MKALATFATGACIPLLEMTAPSHRAFAKKHGYVYCQAPPSEVTVRAEDRSVSWARIPIIQELLTAYDEVLWLDADALVLNPADDIFLPQSKFQALHTQEIAGWKVPNNGVWKLRAGTKTSRFLDLVWLSDEWATHPWTENGAIIQLLGYEVTPQPEPRDLCGYNVVDYGATLWRKGTHELNETFNSMVRSSTFAKPRIRHYAGLPWDERALQIRRDIGE